MATAATESYKVERKNTYVNHKMMPVGSIVELTEKQALGMANKVSKCKVEAPKVKVPTVKK